jgi:tetratricopeptide (TPR) repeat protein
VSVGTSGSRIAFLLGVSALACSWAAGLAFSVRAEGSLPGLKSDSLTRARLLAGEGRRDEAVREYRTAWRIDPGNTAAADAASALMLGSGTAEGAIDLQRQALAWRPLDPRRHTALAAALVEGRRFDEALRHLDLALKVAPQYAPAHVVVGDVWWNRGDAVRAAQEYARAISSDPSSADAHNKLGIALALLGKTSLAVEHFERAARLAPESAEVKANLARAKSALNGSSP